MRRTASDARGAEYPSTLVVREQPSDEEREEECGQEVSVYRAFVAVPCLFRRQDEVAAVRRVLAPARTLGYPVRIRLRMGIGDFGSVSGPREEDPAAQKGSHRYERGVVCKLPRPEGPHGLRIVNHHAVPVYETT